jgi:TetR/AcrR family transcriptional regulator, transcriptional repressor for nem operon
MARGIEFDYDKAINSATRLFWKSGYSDTSLRDLLQVMKIGEGSFYNTIKSKKNLYLLCLKHYVDTIIRKRQAVLFSAPTAKLAVRGFFKTILDEMDDSKTPNSCLMASSVSRDVLEVKELREYLLGHMASFGGRFVQRLKTAKESGEFPSDFQPEIAVQVIVTYIQGMQRVAIISFDRNRVEREIDALLTGLGL